MLTQITGEKLRQSDDSNGGAQKEQHIDELELLVDCMAKDRTNRDQLPNREPMMFNKYPE